MIKTRNKYTSLRKFLDEAKRGEKYVYHTGFLCEDIMQNEVLAKANEKIWSAYMRGLIDLVQRKVKTDTHSEGPVYEYIAVRTTHVGPRVFTGCYATKE